MSDVTKSPNLNDFSVLFLIHFLYTKNRYFWISHANLAI